MVITSLREFLRSIEIKIVCRLFIIIIIIAQWIFIDMIQIDGYNDDTLVIKVMDGH